MISALSPDEERRTLSAFNQSSQAAALSTTSWSVNLPPAQPAPGPDLIREIGRGAEGDAFRGSSPDLQMLLEALVTNYGEEPPQPTTNPKGNQESAQAAREFSELASEASRALHGLARQGEETVAAQQEMARREPTETPSSNLGEVEPLEAHVSRPEPRPVEEPGEQQLLHEDLPQARPGRTSPALEVPADKAGRRAVEQEKANQTEAGQDNRHALSENRRLHDQADHDREQLEALSEQTEQGLQTQDLTVEESLRRREGDESQLETTRDRQQEAHEELQARQDGVAEQAGQVASSEQSLSLARSQRAEAQQEVSNAEQMSSQLEGRPLNQGGGQAVQSSSRQAELRVAARESGARLREAMTEQFVARAESRLEQDRETLRQAEEQSEKTLKKKEQLDQNLTTAEQNLAQSLQGLHLDEAFRERLLELRQEFLRRLELNQEFRWKLDTSREVLEHNIEATQINLERLHSHPVSPDGTTRVELRELQTSH